METLQDISAMTQGLGTVGITQIKNYYAFSFCVHIYQKRRCSQANSSLRLRILTRHRLRLQLPVLC